MRTRTQALERFSNAYSHFKIVKGSFFQLKKPLGCNGLGVQQLENSYGQPHSDARWQPVRHRAFV